MLAFAVCHWQQVSWVEEMTKNAKQQQVRGIWWGENHMRERMCVLERFTHTQLVHEVGQCPSQQVFSFSLPFFSLHEATWGRNPVPLMVARVRTCDALCLLSSPPCPFPHSHPAIFFWSLVSVQVAKTETKSYRLLITIPVINKNFQQEEL